jgi:hypothetical protein
MSEENENKPTESNSDVQANLTQIEELKGKVTLVRWGMFIGVIAIMAIGISSIWNTTKKAAKPAVEVYNEAKDVFDGVQGKINAAQKDYNRIEPKATKAYNTIKGLLDRDSKEWKTLRAEFKESVAKEIKPAAENLAKTVLVDIQDEALEKFDEISAHSEKFIALAHNEYTMLTNNVPKSISKAVEETLVKTISEREAKMREMFPKLTKEKQTLVISRLSNFSTEESRKILVALFADHLSELDKLQNSMDAIYAKEAENIVNKTAGVETSLALLSSIIELAMGAVELEDDVAIDKPEKNPKPKDKPTPPAGKKPLEPKKEDTSADSQ